MVAEPVHVELPAFNRETSAVLPHMELSRMSPFALCAAPTSANIGSTAEEVADLIKVQQKNEVYMLVENQFQRHL